MQAVKDEHGTTMHVRVEVFEGKHLINHFYGVEFHLFLSIALEVIPGEDRPASP